MHLAPMTRHELQLVNAISNRIYCFLHPVLTANLCSRRGPRRAAFLLTRCQIVKCHDCVRGGGGSNDACLSSFREQRRTQPSESPHKRQDRCAALGVLVTKLGLIPSMVLSSAGGQIGKGVQHKHPSRSAAARYGPACPLNQLSKVVCSRDILKENETGVQEEFGRQWARVSSFRCRLQRVGEGCEASMGA